MQMYLLDCVVNNLMRDEQLEESFIKKLNAVNCSASLEPFYFLSGTLLEGFIWTIMQNEVEIPI